VRLTHLYKATAYMQTKINRDFKTRLQRLKNSHIEEAVHGVPDQEAGH
jgi:hypothetical protein